jgi:putative glutamine amidotransferase
MNVATGGTMIQDIPLEVYKKKKVEDILALSSDKQHRNYANDIQDSMDLFWGNIHPIKFITGSWPEKEGLAKPSQYPVVVSSHHQAVEKTGKDLRIVATSMDGKIIEAIDHQKYQNVFGFQFHPEVTDIYNYNNSYQCNPGSEKESLRLMIEKENGYKFHLALWGKFADVLNEMKK